jgi:toxin ParE1/3/4
MKRIFWSLKSTSDLKSIFQFYKDISNFKIARIQVSYIHQKVKVLLRNPDIGPLEDHPIVYGRGFRYLIVRHFKIVYKVYGDEILIMTVFDTRQNPSKFNT